MATATRHEKPAPVIVQPPPVVTIQLLLSEPEAQTLRAIVMRVSGDPNTSRRGHADDISRALYAAGIQDIVPGREVGELGSTGASRLHFNPALFPSSLK